MPFVFKLPDPPSGERGEGFSNDLNVCAFRH
ncbi:hypothetical protein VPHK45_0003 [Vibrio phage K45]